MLIHRSHHATKDISFEIVKMKAVNQHNEFPKNDNPAENSMVKLEQNFLGQFQNNS